MGAGVEPGRFELPPHLRERISFVVSDDHGAAVNHAIHVEHSKTDALHVKRTYCDAERGTLLEERVACGARRLCLHGGNE